MKFSKQFQGQLVPEWKEAFVDYWQLKKELKRMQLLNADHLEPETTTPYSPAPFAQRLVSSLRRLSLIFDASRRREHGAIQAFLHELKQPLWKHFELNPSRSNLQVHRKLTCSASRGVLYETELLEQFADTDAAKEFFSRLDLQLNKVNQFYQRKEQEFLERGESLRKQMDILLSLKEALQKQQLGRLPSAPDSKDDPSISCSISCEEDSSRGATVEEAQESKEILATESERNDQFQSLSGRVFSFQGRNLKIKIPMTTPYRTLIHLLREDLGNQSKKFGGNLKVNKTKLHHAEKMIRGAFIELYKGLNYLKTYRSLNMLAFVKILKKIDKVTGKQVLNIYLKVVESSYFNSSDMAIKLMDEVEELFIKHFANDDKRKAMKYLKPHQREESHSVTFFIGLFTGCFIALFTGYCIMAHIAGMYTGQSDAMYMETVYPVLSMFSLLFLHVFLYGCNIFMWRKARINYTFIFEFDPTKELKYREVFLICATSMTLVVGVILAHLSLVAKGYSSTQVQAIPGFLFLFFLILLICPFNIMYRSSRYTFLRVIRNIILAPLYKVVMVDFFMADQLCSQVPMLRSMEYVACYYITSSYRTQDYGLCMRSKHYGDLSYAVSFLPYYWRAMQCARRWFDEGETSHLINLGKYVSAMLAAGAKVAYEREKTTGWLLLVVAVSSAATVYQLYWDFVKDWGLLQFNSKNPWLRNELILRRKFVYYLSMALNLILRLAWVQTLLHYNFGNVDYRVTSFFLAALEVVRRGHWNFYRLENEHLNNSGKFRAVKTVPLPFHEVNED